MANDIYYVYGYWIKDACEPLYAGKGHGDRARHHFRIAKRPWQRTVWHRKLRQLLDAGYEIEINYWGEGLTESAAFTLEKAMIQKFGRRDLGTGCLYNRTDGGDGDSGHFWSPEEKKQIGERAKGRIPSARTRKKMSESRRVFWTDEKRTLLAVKMRGNQNGCWRNRPIIAERWDGKTLCFDSLLAARQQGYRPAYAIEHGNKYKGARWRYA